MADLRTMSKKGLRTVNSHGIRPPGISVDSSIIIEAERKHQTVEDLLTTIWRHFGEVEIVISAITVAELVHGVERAGTPEIRQHRRAFIDELKKHVPVQRINWRDRQPADL
jgi:tRNA(fMet)-specific endonuclease VapC